jgi:polyphosphate kinase
LISILGQFLEHSRIYYFRNNDNPRLFIGSADWQRRNLDDRVEAIVEIDQPGLKARLIRTLLLALEDRRTAWELRPDGCYLLRHPAENESTRGFQEVLMERARARSARDESPWDIH